MSEKLKPQMHVDIEYLSKALKLPEEEKIVFLTELFQLIKSKGLMEQFLDICQRTLDKEAFESVLEWVRQNENRE
jgi:hypothetical protein